MLGCAATAVAPGADRGGDLLNYPFYNGYALLNGRLDQDLAAAGHASYFNPLLDAVHYLGISRLTPMVFTALLGALQGLRRGAATHTTRSPAGSSSGRDPRGGRLPGAAPRVYHTS